MRVYFSGAESPSHRALLLACDVQALAFNVTSLYKRMPKRKTWTEAFTGWVPEGADILFYPGRDDADVDSYREFLAEMGERATYIIGMPGLHLDLPQYVPIWEDTPNKVTALRSRMEQHAVLAIPDELITSSTVARRIEAHRMATRSRLIGITSDSENLRLVKWEAVVVSSWTSAQRFGETQVWAGNRLHRYPATQKKTAREKHRVDIERLGVDYQLVCEDDPKEVARLAVASWRQLEATRPSAEIEPEEPEIATTLDDQPTPDMRSREVEEVATRGALARHEGDRRVLPGLRVERAMLEESSDGSGPPLLSEQPVLRYDSTQSVRQCDSCAVSPACPAFRAHHACAWTLPIEIRTKDQLQHVLRIVLEMQTARVLFGRFAEELEGQGIDSTVSAEMDRLFAMVKAHKDINDTRDFVKIEAEVRSSGGALSRIFGSRVGEQARVLPGGPIGELDTSRALAEVLDAEIVE